MLDPLIAEARQRARRRNVLLATGVVMLLIGGGATAAGFFTYLHYNPQNATPGPMIVLVATRNIAAGTPASVVLRRDLYRVMAFRPDQVLDGAVGDPSLLAGKVASRDIVPNEQLTASDFGSPTG